MNLTLRRLNDFICNNCMLVQLENSLSCYRLFNQYWCPKSVEYLVIETIIGEKYGWSFSIHPLWTKWPSSIGHFSVMSNLRREDFQLCRYVHMYIMVSFKGCSLQSFQPLLFVLSSIIRIKKKRWIGFDSSISFKIIFKTLDATYIASTGWSTSTLSL